MKTKLKAKLALESMVLTGADVRRLMRKNKITIRELAAKMGMTLKQVRAYRCDSSPLVGHSAACVYEWITGSARIRLLYTGLAGNLRMQENE